MTLTHTLRLLLACSLLVIAASCRELDLGELPGSGSTTAGGDALPSLNLADAISVAEAQRVPEDTEVTVMGYVVGFVDGTSLSHAMFSSSDKAVNTNFLLADDEFCDDEDFCLPVELPAKSAMRDELNTYDHPELFRACVLLRGKLTSYFRTKGLKACSTWRIITDEGPGTDPTPEPEPTPDPEPQPQPEPGPSPVLKLPQIDYSVSASRAR